MKIQFELPYNLPIHVIKAVHTQYLSLTYASTRDTAAEIC